MFDRNDCHDAYCILCWVRETIDPLASLAKGVIRAKGKAFKTLRGIERATGVRYVG